MKNKFGILIAVLSITLASCTNQSKKQDVTVLDSMPLDTTLIESKT